MQVLVTRPLETGQTLTQKLTTLGFRVVHFPVINFQPTTQQETLKNTINHLSNYDIAIFVSQAAVKFTLPLISKPTLIPIQWAAIGPSTQSALNQFGISTIIVPPAPPFESETLLQTAPLQQQAVSKKKVIIFRGNGGRNLLQDSLTNRGASVNCVDAYERILPSPPTEAVLTHWRKNPFDAIVLSSQDCLQHFLQLTSTDAAWLKECSTVVVGLRMAAVANKLGFRRLLIADGADDTSIIQTLQLLKG
jgi:uroporphyrinogen-III synthase